MPPINFSNVNISIHQFQEISTGEINAGEVRLLNEHTLDKINNRAHRRGSNTVTLSHHEVLAIKNAFVRTLSESGVGADEINRIRQKLGLAPAKAVDTSLLDRSIQPLSRQQIREILDRNAGTINAHVGADTIRTSEELQARLPPREVQNRRTRRESVNAELPSRRALEENRRVAIFQSVIAGDVDFHDDAKRRDMLSMAKRCLETVLVRCHGQPRAGERCEIKRSTSSGASVVMDTGLDEAGFVRKMEETIVRLSRSRIPLDEEMAVRREFKALATQQARAQWIGRLWGSERPQDALKARVVAVMVLQERGVSDADTLSIANRLDNVGAISFAINLVQGAADLEGDALRNSAIVQGARAAINPETRISPFEQAYVPALSDQEFNAEIANGLHGSPQKLPESFMLLLRSAADEMRARYGAAGYPDQADFSYLTEGSNTNELTGADNPDAPRITPETLRGRFMEAAVESSAKRFMRKSIQQRMAAAGYDASRLASDVTNSLRALKPEILQRLCAAQSPEEAEAVMGDYSELILQTARRAATCDRCDKAMRGWALEAVAQRLGVPAASLDKRSLALKAFDPIGTRLSNEIMNTDHPAKTDAEIEAVFRAAVDKFVNDHMAILDQIDHADLPPAAKDAFKAAILATEKVKDIDVDAMVNGARNAAEAGRHLLALLSANAPKDQIYGAMRAIMGPLATAKEQILAAARAQGREIGVDEAGNILEPMVAMVVLSQPGLEDMLAEFLVRDDVDADFTMDETQPASAMISFLGFKKEPGANAALAAKIGTDSLPALHAKAVADAVRAEEGLGNLTNAEALALFKPGNPAGEHLRLFVESFDGAVRPSTLGDMARAAILPFKDAILAARRDNASVPQHEQAFLNGPGAQRALQAGFARVELPRLARTFALYKLAANATDEAALEAVLDPESKASRLISYGGRFAESVENFRAGLKLLDDFGAWYDQLGADLEAHKTDTPTLFNASAERLKPAHKRSHEKFIFDEIAVNANLSLRPASPEEVFGMANNPATRFVGREYMLSMTNTLAQIPPEKRSLLYAVFDAMSPLNRTAADKAANTPFSMNVTLAARVLKNYDAVAALRDAGNLDRAHIIELLFSDFGIPPTATNLQMFNLYTDGMLALMRNELRTQPQLMGPVELTIQRTGATKQEALAAVLEGRTLPSAPHHSPIASAYESLFTAQGGRTAMCTDLGRPAIATFAGTDAPVTGEANARFKFRFSNGTSFAVEQNPGQDAQGVRSPAGAADKIAEFCGTLHQAQLSAVYYALSQSALVPLNRGLLPYGINSTEHAPVIYTLDKNAETGDITIRYSEPDGFPIRFSWETTVHLDGSTESTPVAVEVLPGFEAKSRTAVYAQLAGVPPEEPLTSSTIAPGQGPAATALRNLVDTRSGAPADATPTEKAHAFATRANDSATKSMVYNLALVASKNLVSGEGEGKHMDFEKVHQQFNRDLQGNYRFKFPGMQAPSKDYNANRDSLVQLVTGDRRATFAGADAAIKRRVGILMSILTQYTGELAQDAVSLAMAAPGGGMGFFAIGQGGRGTDFKLSRDADGNIKVEMTRQTDNQAFAIFDEKGDTTQIAVQPGSHSEYKLSISIPRENLEELADADWTQYDRKAVHDFDGDMDGRVNLIPDQYRFKGTVTVACHFHAVES
jgi:hypothetical protein